MQYYKIDYDDYPIIRIKIYPVNPSIEQIDQFIEELTDGIMARKGGYVTISDASEAVFIENAKKDKLAEFANRNHELFGGRQKCSIIVVKTDVVRIMLKGINFFFPKDYEEAIVGSHAEAEKVARERLAKHGIHLDD